MYIPKHPNYIKSSNLTFGTVVLGLISFLLSPKILGDGKYIAISILSLLFVVGIGFLVRQGIDWVKYLLLVLMIIGWAIVLLFKVPNPIKNNRTWHPTKNS